VDDAVAFVKRELRRNKQYEAILLDPPTYGHGIQGDRWEIHRDLIPLMDDCWQLLSDQRRLVLLCGHSSHVRIRDINTHLAQRHGRESVIECEVAQAYLCDLSGRKLDCGFAAKYSLG
jgi:23S rRNA (cytosine1962-C5)-methyltransferase